MEETKQTVEETELELTKTEEAVAETVEVAEDEDACKATEAVEEVEVAEAVVAKKGMNLPNKLTLLRICLVPVMVVLFYLGTASSITSALGVFIIASITDFLDGHIARKNDIVTDFGKFLDPIADKLLVITAITLLTFSNIIMFPMLAQISLIIIIAREFAISGLRLIAANNGTVIAADKLGKLKTVTQIIAIILLMLTLAFYLYMSQSYSMGIVPSELAFQVFNYLAYSSTGVYFLSTLICIISGISYLVKNRKAFMLSK